MSGGKISGKNASLDVIHSKKDFEKKKKKIITKRNVMLWML